MPTYTYECQKCGATFEVVQSITAPAGARCSCGEKKKVKRVITGGAGFLFKGSGFYSTDYRSESYKQAAKKEKESSPEVKTSTDTEKPKTESKPEKKPAAEPKTAVTAAKV